VEVRESDARHVSISLLKARASLFMPFVASSARRLWWTQLLRPAGPLTLSSPICGLQPLPIV
jgi:hypothetical protein